MMKCAGGIFCDELVGLKRGQGCCFEEKLRKINPLGWIQRSRRTSLVSGGLGAKWSDKASLDGIEGVEGHKRWRASVRSCWGS